MISAISASGKRVTLAARCAVSSVAVLRTASVTTNSPCLALAGEPPHHGLGATTDTAGHGGSSPGAWPRRSGQRRDDRPRAGGLSRRSALHPAHPRPQIIPTAPPPDKELWAG